MDGSLCRLCGSIFICAILALTVFASHASAAHKPEKGRTAAKGSFAPEWLPPMKPGQQEVVGVVLHWSQETCRSAKPAKVRLSAPKEFTVTPPVREVPVKPGRKSNIFFKVTCRAEAPVTSRVTALLNSDTLCTLSVGTAYGLETLVWKSKFDKDKVADSQGWMRPEFDDSTWQERRLPSMWQENGVTYLRAKLFVPNSWRGHDIRLGMKAVDDNDICYLNGIEIGRTNGWDIQRSYKIDPKVVRFGEENALCMAVDNPTAGGGVYRSPNYFGIERPAEKSPEPVMIPPPRKQGNPLPLRQMRVDNGVLVYEDGGEVALWGVNYYPQSWHQYDNLKRRGVDIKKSIRDDLDDMKRMGVEVIRIHVFDREISDAKGDLVDNEHQELLDYLISEGTKRDIYFMFAPIAWWPGPGENPDSFSARTPKEYMFCDDEAITAAANYLKNWLNHINRFTGKHYRDEPAICALEIMNEPAYVDYSGMMDPNWTYYPFAAKLTPPCKKRLMEKWRAWCASNGVAEESGFFPIFRYELMSRYLDAMYTAIRHTGAKQPVACGLYDTGGQDDLTSAIADSRCEAVATGWYPGDWDKDADRVNLLPMIGNTSLDPKLNNKARVVYEFDAIRTLDSYLYPAFAKRFRNIGVQICAMFQYDSRHTAQWNSDWNCHYLNLFYTPAKSVSFVIGGKAFHNLARGAALPNEGGSQVFGNCAISFDRNISIYSKGSTYLSSAPNKEWRPVDISEKPKHIMAVGDSFYASYAGNGIYTLEIDYNNRTAKLTINPDAKKVGDPWRPDNVKSVMVLEENTHPFKVTIPGVEIKGVSRNGEPVAITDGSFEVRPGEYKLMW